MPSEVPPLHTPVTSQQVYDAITQAWPMIAGGAAPQAAALVLLAQSWFETGSGKNVWNWNFGGVKHVFGDGFDWVMLHTTEGTPPQPTVAAFRAMPSLQEGVSNWMSLLYKHYGDAWARALAGDPSGFVQAIKARGYFTGPLDNYVNGVVSYYNQFVTTIGRNVPSPTVKSYMARAVEVTGAVAAGVGTGVTVSKVLHRIKNRKSRKVDNG